MKVFLKKDVEKLGMAGEILKVSEGHARNLLIPQGLAIEVTPHNEGFYKSKVKEVVDRKSAVESKTSMLAERIKSIKIKLKKKMHDDGKLYGAVSALEVVDLLAKEGINIAKSQVLFDKSIKSKGSYEVTIKLTSRLKPKIQLFVVGEQ